ncbi:MAG: MATE family efflux transporter [Dysgonamonadaceae bacterium]|nr:MATE family efflux transporter [Dysgonamonadaceae bacterium]
MPLMAVSFMQMAYNLIDLAWVGCLGSKSVAAVGTVGLLVWMINSIAFISKVGAEVSIGQSIGAKRFDKAAVFASHTTMIALALGILFGCLFFFAPQYFIAFFKLPPEISEKAARFLQIIALAVPFIFLNLNFAGIYIGTGRSEIPFYFNLVGLGINILLDPLLIFGFVAPFPALGTEGAAIATAFSVFVVTVLFLFHLKNRNRLSGRFSLFTRPRTNYVFKILKLGLPVATMNVFFSIINMNLVRIASIHGGHLGVTSQTTGGQIEGVTWNTSQGFATALGSFVAQNYAAGKMQRAKTAYRYTLQIMGVLGTVVTASFMLFGSAIFSVFIPEKAAYEAGGEYLFIIGISQLFMMLELTTQGMFNGIGRTTPPAVISMTLNFIRIPLAMFLAARMGIAGVWWAIAISTIVKGTTLPLWFYLVQKRMQRGE